ncbi:HlyD family secretion protein [Roseateles koreensis]|uniref:HlyD family efflux transporter periplasmic adaptor subunit n=1 Tax=Roseateles koreensis TaxID=2987526 RepID=A0ABT5KUV2_9BURK|nr:HlyD family efflux transporter periplasmic adaptor subunit [Roseateles koreensis]MDC8786612.1 HlyD family efflux transporter periplasmic adaptor subunit [Roseateles koreensis]
MTHDVQFKRISACRSAHIGTGLIGAGLLCLLAACKPAPPSAWAGYVEGEPLYLAAPVAGRLAELPVQVGDTVVAQQVLFVLEGAVERAADAEAQARADSARAQLADAGKGRRPEELAVSEAQLRQARSARALAQADLQRQQELLTRNFVARAAVEDAQLKFDQAQARVGELEAALKTAHLPAREDERQSARELALAAARLREQSQWRLSQTRQSAPEAGVIQDVFYRPGEWVAAGQPVLALLPPARRKARFYVPEAQLGRLALKQAVRLSCDGCGAPIAAQISFISAQAEYTPPVIYSNEQRAKLVFMVEARPVQLQDAERLHPGQPMDVRVQP